MLGHKLVQKWHSRFNLWATVRGGYADYEQYGFFERDKLIENIDIENINSVEVTIERLRPDVIVNAVGIIKQLPSAKNVIKTLMVNAIFPHQLAEISSRLGARLITISTDCVFSGKTGKYTEADVADATDLYGRSKSLGEVAADNCLTIRTSIIGRELNTAHGLVEWFLSNQGKSVKGYRRAVFSGFPTLMLADIIADLIENKSELQGLFHVSSEPINKFDLLKLVKEAYEVNVEIEPFDDFEIDRSLDSTKFRAATGFTPKSWREMVEQMTEDDILYQNGKYNK